MVRTVKLHENVFADNNVEELKEIVETTTNDEIQQTPKKKTNTMQLDEFSHKKTMNSSIRDSGEENTSKTNENSSEAHDDVSEEAKPSGKHEQVEELLLEAEKLTTNENTELYINEKQSNKGEIIPKGTKKDTQSNLKQEVGCSDNQSVTESNDKYDEREKMSDEIPINEGLDHTLKVRKLQEKL